MFSKRNQSRPASPCGFAFDDRNGQIVIAEYSDSGGFDIYRAIIGERRAVDLTSSDLRTTLTKGNAHSDRITLLVAAASPDEDILRAIIDKTNGDQSHMMAFTRTPDARIIVTQVEASAVSEIVKRANTWLEEQQAQHIASTDKTLRAETRTRAITRLWRASQGDTELAGTTAILVIGDDDYAIGLWSEESSLVYETEELFERGAPIEIKCQHARDVFTRFVTDASLGKLNLPPVTNAVLSAAQGYAEPMLTLLNESPELDSVLIEEVCLQKDDKNPLDQPTAFALGSLLDHAAVPACNLAISLESRIEEIELERQLLSASATSHQARAAMLAILIPFVAVFAFLFAAWADNTVEAARLESRINEETVVGQQLTQANADYESSKANFGAFHSLLDNLIGLRQRQPAVHQLLSDLNQRWPQGDNTWYISEINVKGSNVEIKGKTKNEQAITSFAKSLEFSNGLFSGILTRNNVEGNSAFSAPQPQSQTPRSSVIEFTITSSYAPLAAPGKPAVANGPTAQPNQMPVQSPAGPQAGQPMKPPAVVPVSPANLPVPAQQQQEVK
jgi:hypothetical protein